MSGGKNFKQDNIIDEICNRIRVGSVLPRVEMSVVIRVPHILQIYIRLHAPIQELLMTAPRRKTCNLRKTSRSLGDRTVNSSSPCMRILNGSAGISVYVSY